MTLGFGDSLDLGGDFLILEARDVGTKVGESCIFFIGLKVGVGEGLLVGVRDLMMST